jgi:hypothetical protein
MRVYSIGMLIGLLVVVGGGGFGLYKFGQLAFELQRLRGTPPVDNTEYSLLVCLNPKGGALYQGVVDHVQSAMNTNRISFDERGTGLLRIISGAVCVITKGTQAEFAAAEATKGGELNDNGQATGTSTDEGNKVDKAK